MYLVYLRAELVQLSNTVHCGVTVIHLCGLVDDQSFQVPDTILRVPHSMLQTWERSQFREECFLLRQCCFLPIIAWRQFVYNN